MKYAVILLTGRKSYNIKLGNIILYSEQDKNYFRDFD